MKSGISELKKKKDKMTKKAVSSWIWLVHRLEMGNYKDFNISREGRNEFTCLNIAGICRSWAGIGIGQKQWLGEKNLCPLDML